MGISQADLEFISVKGERIRLAITNIQVQLYTQTNLISYVMTYMYGPIHTGESKKIKERSKTRMLSSIVSRYICSVTLISLLWALIIVLSIH